MIVSGQGPNVNAICAGARRLLGTKLKHSREVLRSGGEDGLYRVHLADSTIVECTVIQHAQVQVEEQSDV